MHLRMGDTTSSIVEVSQIKIKYAYQLCVISKWEIVEALIFIACCSLVE